MIKVYYRFRQISSEFYSLFFTGLATGAQLYQIHLSSQRKDLLGSSLVKVPAPCFVVFYNGDKELPDVSSQRLSDVFEPKGKAGGFEDSERSGKQEDARNLRTMGLLTHEQISQATGLSVEDIRALAAAGTEPVLA